MIRQPSASWNTCKHSKAIQGLHRSGEAAASVAITLVSARSQTRMLSRQVGFMVPDTEDQPQPVAGAAQVQARCPSCHTNIGQYGNTIMQDGISVPAIHEAMYANSEQGRN